MILLRILSLLLAFLVTLACKSIQLNVPRNAFVVNNRTSRGRLTYIIEGIQLEGHSNEDCAANRLVRVDVFTRFQSGELRLNKAFSSLADFTCSSLNWNCQGGSNDSEGCSAMIFVADPMDVAAILSNLTFAPFITRDANKNGPEFIVVKVYSGQGGSCWANATDEFDLMPSNSDQHSMLSDNDNNCAQTQGMIPIPPIPPAGRISSIKSQQQEKSQEWYQNALFDSIVVLFLGCLVMCCCAISHWWTYAQPCSLRENMPETGHIKKGTDALFYAWDGGDVVVCEFTNESPRSGPLPVSPNHDNANTSSTQDADGERSIA